MVNNLVFTTALDANNDFELQFKEDGMNYFIVLSEEDVCIIRNKVGAHVHSFSDISHNEQMLMFGKDYKEELLEEYYNNKQCES